MLASGTFAASWVFHKLCICGNRVPVLGWPQAIHLPHHVTSSGLWLCGLWPGDCVALAGAVWLWRVLCDLVGVVWLSGCTVDFMNILRVSGMFVDWSQFRGILGDI